MDFKRVFLDKKAMEAEYAVALILVIILGGLFLWILYKKITGVQ